MRPSLDDSGILQVSFPYEAWLSMLFSFLTIPRNPLNPLPYEPRFFSIYLKSFSLPTLPNKTRTKAKTVIRRLVFSVRSQFFSKAFGISPAERTSLDDPTFWNDCEHV